MRASRERRRRNADSSCGQSEATSSGRSVRVIPASLHEAPAARTAARLRGRIEESSRIVFSSRARAEGVIWASSHPRPSQRARKRESRSLTRVALEEEDRGARPLREGFALRLCRGSCSLPLRPAPSARDRTTGASAYLGDHGRWCAGSRASTRATKARARRRTSRQPSPPPPRSRAHE